MSAQKEMIGIRFGRLLVLEFSHIDSKTRRRHWKCLCDCGNTSKADGVYLRSGNIKSCGCLKRNKLGELTKKENSGILKLERTYKKSAKLRGYSYELSYESFKSMTSSPCFYCGCMPSKVSIKQSREGAYLYNGLDRKDNKIGYTPANCVPCCYECNFLKKDTGFNEFILHIRRIATNTMEVTL